MKNRLKHNTLLTTLTYLSICFPSLSQDLTKIEASTGVLMKVDSLETVLQTSKEDTSKVNILNKLCYEYRKKDTYQALNYGKQGLDLAKLLKFKRGIAKSLYNIGYMHVHQSNYKKALDYHLKALKIYEEIGNKKGLSESFQEIGIINLIHGRNEVALDYFLKSIELKRELGNKASEATSLSMIGNVYLNQDKYKKALDYYMKSLTIHKKLENKKGAGYNLSYIGWVYYQQKKYKKALEYLERSLRINEELKDKYGIASDLNRIGSIYMDQGNYEKVIECDKRSLIIAKEVGTKGPIASAYYQLSRAYFKLNEYKKAYENQKLYTQIIDTIYNEEKSKEIGKLEAKYEFEKAEIERKRKLEEQTRILEEQTERRNLLQYSGILIFIVAFFIILLFSGRLNIPVRLAEGGVFFTFLLVFEFLLVLTDPYLEQYTGGEPAYKLIVNAGLAGLIFPLHSFFETKLKSRIVK